MAAEMAKARAEITARQQEWLKEFVDGGEGYFTAIKKCTQKLQVELKEAQMKIQKKHGNAFAPKKDDVTAALGDLSEADNMLQIVRPGDASVAAPFTSKIPSIKSCVDLIRQGRCTLLSALQQQQIMMLQSIISAFVLSAISLEGARSSERQMMASSWLILTASLAFSYSTPIEQMSPQRPLKSLFHPAIFVSMMGQAAIHLGCMMYAVNLATSTMGPAALKEVVEFNKKVYAGESVAEDPDEEPDPWAEMMTLWSKPFMPNLMNTVIFLVETSQIMAVLLVNYKGRPWMKGIVENHALCLSLFITIAALFVLAWGISPELNTAIHLHEFPDDEFRWKVVTLVAISLVGTFVWDRIVTAIFAPDIAKIMFKEASQTTLADLLPVFTTMFKVVAGVAVFASGNIVVWGAVAYFFWKRRAAAQ
jgi:cation-transporting ATPase 13A1